MQPFMVQGVLVMSSPYVSVEPFTEIKLGQARSFPHQIAQQATWDNNVHSATWPRRITNVRAACHKFIKLSAKLLLSFNRDCTI